MQSVNDDMEELFRKAATNYPLKTGSADWNKIAGQLGKPEGDFLFRRYQKKLLWLLLLIPFSLICNQYFVDSDQSRMAVASRNLKKTTTAVVPNNDLSKTSKNKGGVPINTEPELKPSEKALYSAHNNERPSGNDNSIVGKNKKPVLLTATNEPDLFGKNLEDQGKASLYATKRNHTEIPYTARAYPSLVPSVHAQPRQMMASVAEKEHTQWEKPDKRFYAGLIGSLDATSIRLQKVDNASYDLGVLLGYKFYKKWSLEAGLSLGKKFYYTKGAYFNTSKIRAFMPPNSEIAAVDGNCVMWEIPLSLRYELKSSVKHTLSVSAGVSSYLMNRESYNYYYYSPSSGQNWEFYKSYPSRSKQALSVVQFSAGYTVNLPKVGAVRLEPYVKLPVKGMGVGSIRLQSTGVHISITKPVF